jgi:hypothetical protein
MECSEALWMVYVNSSITESRVGKEVSSILTNSEDRDQLASFTTQSELPLQGGHFIVDRQIRKRSLQQRSSSNLCTKEADTAGLHIARLRHTGLPETRDKCVGSPVFSTTQLNLDISVHHRSLSVLICTAPDMVLCIQVSKQ